MRRCSKATPSQHIVTVLMATDISTPDILIITKHTNISYSCRVNTFGVYLVGLPGLGARARSG